jgi:lysophospholipase L1-like esterase
MSFGDSIVAGDGNNYVGPQDYIASRYKMTLSDWSNGGATMGVTGSNDILTQIASGISSGFSPDIIIFDGGTNDITNPSTSTPDNPAVPLGTLVSSIASVESLADPTTFSGAMELAVSRLQVAFPKAVIIYIRVHQMSSRNVELQETYGERAITICKRWGVPYINLYDIFGRYPSKIRETFLADFTHPNADGYKYKYLPSITAKIEELLTNWQ